MPRVLLRRSTADAASADVAAEVVASLQARVIGRSDPNLLVEVANDEQVDALRGRLDGWIVSPQGPSIPVPDTRLTVR